MNKEEFEELKSEAAEEIVKRIYERGLSYEETVEQVKSKIGLIFGGYLITE